MFPSTAPPGIEASKIPPRPYQLEALEALDEHLRTRADNPCVVIPTGGGKSLVIAWAIQRWKADYPPFRCIILAHRKELVAQNAAELSGLWPGGDVGVYSAGLGLRNTDASVTFASIDSVWNKWGDFRPFDVVLIDEAHRIPAKGEGKYLSFLRGCRTLNPSVRSVGFTATPYRLGMGPICHPQHVLNAVCYEAKIGSLIADGYLCRLRSKVGAAAPDLSGVRVNAAGDYAERSLAEAVEVPSVVQAAVREAMAAINSECRKSVVFFCVDVAHCEAVSHELRRYGVHAPWVTANTPERERDRVAEDFKQGRIRCLLNVNVYTEGFNAKRVDCVVLLRPTLSRGLYAQMVGRGLRLHPDKTDCLVLDFARCIETHGPIDHLDAGEVRLIVCGSVRRGDEEEAPKTCGDTFPRALGACPNCGWKIPPAEVKRDEEAAAEERARKLHDAEASKRSILGSEPEELQVDDVVLQLHRKAGSRDSVRVTYRCGRRTFNEWLCLDHGGPSEARARRWWAARFGPEEARTVTVGRALDDLFAAQAIRDLTESITVVQSGKYAEIVSHKLRGSSGQQHA